MPELRRFSIHRPTLLTCAFAAFTAVVCGGLLAAAVLVPAPLDVLPLVIFAGVGMPMVAAWQAPQSLQRPRREVSAESPEHLPLDSGAIRKLRRQLAQIPEIRHPLDL